MDTSETFIKMSVKSGLDKCWEFQRGDYVVFRDTGRLDKPIAVRLVIHVNNAGTIYLAGDYDFQSYKPEQLYPLPRQDQLQEMVKVFESDTLTLQYNFMEWCVPYFSAKGKFIYQWYVIGKTSTEQLWLAFAQKELHNKTWDGEEWTVKIPMEVV